MFLYSEEKSPKNRRIFDRKKTQFRKKMKPLQKFPPKKPFISEKSQQETCGEVFKKLSSYYQRATQTTRKTKPHYQPSQTITVIRGGQYESIFC